MLEMLRIIGSRVASAARSCLPRRIDPAGRSERTDSEAAHAHACRARWPQRQRSPLRRGGHEAAAVVAVLAVHGLREKGNLEESGQAPARAASTDESCSSLRVQSPAPARALFPTTGARCPVRGVVRERIFGKSFTATENAIATLVLLYHRGCIKRLGKIDRTSLCGLFVRGANLRFVRGANPVLFVAPVAGSHAAAVAHCTRAAGITAT